MREALFTHSFLVLFFTLIGDKTPPGFPVITQGPSTRVIEVGHTAVMQCKAIGNPTPTIYWIKNQTKVDMSNPRYSIKDGEYQYRKLCKEGYAYKCTIK